MTPTPGATPGRNEPCHCGSKRKYKHCCLQKDEAAEKAARATAEEAAASAPAETATVVPPRAPKHQTHQPWKGSTARGFIPRTRLPRKVGGS